MRYFRINFMVMLIVLSASLTAYSWTMKDVSIHGFGGWAYGRTFNENFYYVGTEDGSYDYVNFSLNMSKNVYEDFRVYFQTSYIENIHRERIELDYAFAEWYLSDRISFRMGKVIAPCMIYTEIYNVGTLRPFFGLPLGMYQHFAPEAYKGLGLTGVVYSDNGWEIIYDLYGGKIELKPVIEPYITTDGQGNILPEYSGYVHFIWLAENMIGERLSVGTPVDGLTFMLSGYLGDIKVRSHNEVMDVDSDVIYKFFGASLEYLSNPWLVRAEFLTNKKEAFNFRTGYLEFAYKLTDHWQIAARHELEEVEEEGFEEDFGKENVDDISSLYEHRDTSFGINYWFNPNFVIKASYHYVEGNIFAKPKDIRTYIENFQSEGYVDTTEMILIGTQFSF